MAQHDLKQNAASTSGIAKPSPYIGQLCGSSGGVERSAESPLTDRIDKLIAEAAGELFSVIELQEGVLSKLFGPIVPGCSDRGSDAALAPAGFEARVIDQLICLGGLVREVRMNADRLYQRI